VERARHQVQDRSGQRRCAVGHALLWFAMRTERRREEPTGGSEVAAETIRTRR
jgi:hypothetical protein